MHIAIDGRVIDDHFPGIGRYVYHLVEALAQDNPADTFTLLSQAQAAQGALGATSQGRLQLGSLTARPNLRLRRVDAPVFGLSAQWRLPAALSRSQASLFHATYWLTAYRPGLPSVLSLYDLIGLRQRKAVPPARRLLLWLSLRLALRNARQVLTLSEAARLDLQRYAGVPADRITVTPLAADERFRPATAEEAAHVRARYELPARYVLYVGSNKPHKNLDTLLRAWPKVIESTEAGEAPAELILAGHRDVRYGPFASELRPGIRDLGAVAEVELPALYGAASVFAFPSLHEGFGLPALEAMACGTPVVASDASSLPEVVGEAGRLVAPRDVRAWSHALAQLLAQPDEAERLAALGQARAATFSWSRTARLTRGAYERALGTGSAR